MVEGVKDYAIFLLDPAGGCHWNAGAERIKGYRADEIIGQHFSASTRRRTCCGKPDMELRWPGARPLEDEGWRLRRTAAASGPTSSSRAARPGRPAHRLRQVPATSPSATAGGERLALARGEGFSAGGGVRGHRASETDTRRR